MDLADDTRYGGEDSASRVIGDSRPIVVFAGEHRSGAVKLFRLSIRADGLASGGGTGIWLISAET